MSHPERHARPTMAPPATGRANPGRSDWVGTLGMVLFAIAGGCAIPWLLGSGETPAASTSVNVLEVNRQRIAAMTDLERKRLETRFAQYRELDEAERARYRRLHDSVSADAELEGAIDAYRNWLETLTHVQRDALRNEPDPEARMKLVATYRDEQIAKERKGGRPGRNGWFGPPVRPEELEGVYAVLVKRLALDEARTRELSAARTPLGRHLFILRASLEAAEDHPGDTRFHWPRKDALEEIVAALPEEHRDRVRDKPEEFRRGDVGRMLLVGLWQEFNGEKDRLEPKDDELKRYFLELDATERDRLVVLPRTEFQRELRDQFALSTRKDMGDFRSVTERLWRHSNGRPFGGRPGDGGRSGTQGRGDGGRGDGGRSDGRPDRGRGGEGRGGDPDTGSPFDGPPGGPDGPRRRRPE